MEYFPFWYKNDLSVQQGKDKWEEIIVQKAFKWFCLFLLECFYGFPPPKKDQIKELHNAKQYATLHSKNNQKSW